MKIQDVTMDKIAFIFDMDGTIVSTESLKALTHSETIKEFGGICSPEIYKQCIGLSFYAVASFMLKTAAIDVDIAVYKETFDKLYKIRIADMRIMIDGVKSFLEKLLKKGFKIGLVSSSNRWMITHILNNIQCGHFFSVIISREDVDHEKPYPDPYIKAQQSLKAQKYIVFEDTDAGITSALASGAKVFGIRHDYNTFQKLEGCCDIFYSYNVIDIDKLIKL